MPASPRSLQITNAYRRRLLAIRDRVEAKVRVDWPADINQLDDTWAKKTATWLSQAQTEAVRVSGGYLTAFLTSELGRKTTGPVLSSGGFAGLFNDGRPLAEALHSPVVGTLVARKDGDPNPLRVGLQRARRMGEVALMHAARESLRTGLEQDPRIEGWRRAVNGTCGACTGDIAVEVRVETPSVPLNIHPNCMCVTEPVVVGVPNTVPRPTGQEMFAAMAPALQDQNYGPEMAAALRTGQVALADLVSHEAVGTPEAPPILTTKPLKGVT